MSNQQNYRPVLRQLLEELVKQPEFASIKGQIDKDMLAEATYEVCAILKEKTRIREQSSMSKNKVDESRSIDDFIFLPDSYTKESDNRGDDNLFFLVPGYDGKKPTTDDDGFDVITFD